MEGRGLDWGHQHPLVAALGSPGWNRQGTGASSLGCWSHPHHCPHPFLLCQVPVGLFRSLLQPMAFAARPGSLDPCAQGPWGQRRTRGSVGSCMATRPQQGCMFFPGESSPPGTGQRQAGPCLAEAEGQGPPVLQHPGMLLWDRVLCPSSAWDVSSPSLAESRGWLGPGWRWREAQMSGVQGDALFHACVWELDGGKGFNMS